MANLFNRIAVAVILVFFLSSCGRIQAGIDNNGTYNTKDVLLETLEEAKPIEELYLNYDDRYSFDKKVMDIQSLEITSTVPGKGILDDEVLKTDKDNLKKVIATACGYALVTLEDGSAVKVFVDKAPISVVMIAGQSNAEGRPSDVANLDFYQNEWIINEEGQVYNTYGPSDEYGQDMYKEVAWYEDEEAVGELSVENANRFVPISLTDNELNDRYNRTDRLTDMESGGKGGIDSAFAYKWHELTGEKIWIINTAHHGSRIETWIPSDDSNNFSEACSLYDGVKNILINEISAGHFSISKIGVLWCQGENNRTARAKKYYKQLKKVVQGFRDEMAICEPDGNSHKMDFFGVLMVRAAADNPMALDDFVMNGPRRALYYIARNKKIKDVFLASQITEYWDTDDHVRDYFYQKYLSPEVFKNAYPTKTDKLKMPSIIEEVHRNIHYTQLAYNEIGIDAAENIFYELGYLEEKEYNILPSIQIMMADGLTDVSDKIVQCEEEYIPFVIKIWPTWLTKEVTIVLPDNVKDEVTGLHKLDMKEGIVEVKVGGVSKKLFIK